jgi:hypothetical protein
LQYQIKQDWMAELSYQGSSGVGLLEAWDNNAVNPAISTNPTLLNQIYTNYQSFRPFPNFGPIYLWSNSGHSTYHAGTIKVEKRYSHGLTFVSFFTMSKAIDDCDNDGYCTGVDPYNHSLEKGRAGFDIHNRSVTYLTYELPFGKGRTWMRGGGIKDYILGGWAATVAQTFQTGTPVMFTDTGSPNHYLLAPGNLPSTQENSATAEGIQRPNQILPNDQLIVANYTIGDRFNNNIKNPIWNINAFANPAPFTLGTLGRNTINGPGVNWTQASLAKTFTVKERYHMEVRYDINNVFKQPNFSNPSSVVNLSNPNLFGKPVATQGGWCCLAGQFVSTLVLKFFF